MLNLHKFALHIALVSSAIFTSGSALDQPSRGGDTLVAVLQESHQHRAWRLYEERRDKQQSQEQRVVDKQLEDTRVQEHILEQQREDQRVQEQINTQQLEQQRIQNQINTQQQERLRVQRQQDAQQWNRRADDRRIEQRRLDDARYR